LPSGIRMKSPPDGCCCGAGGAVAVTGWGAGAVGFGAGVTSCGAPGAAGCLPSQPAVHAPSRPAAVRTPAAMRIEDGDIEDGDRVAESEARRGRRPPSIACTGARRAGRTSPVPSGPAPSGPAPSGLHHLALPARPLALVLLQEHLAQPHRLRRDLDQFVLGDVLEPVLDAEHARRRHLDERLLGRAAHVGRLLLARQVDAQVVVLAVLADDHALVDLGALGDEELAAVAQAV